jgi:hypothetical protein
MKKLLLFAILSFSLNAQNNVQVSTGTFFEGEPYLAIHPTNQQHLVAAWMGFQLNNKVVIKSSVSTNGGVTWSTPTWQPHEQTNWSSADPSLAFHHSGTLYMSYIDYDNEAHSAGKIVLRKSIDGGLTWGNAVEAISTADCPNKLCIDRPWIAVDNSGTSTDGTIYITSMNANQPTLVTPPYNPYVTVSIDNGASFAPPRFLDTLDFLAGSTVLQPMPTPTVTSNGKFYAIYPSYLPSQSPFARLILASSTNACLDVNHQIAFQSASPFLANNATNLLLKAGYLLRSNPNDPNHLAYFFLSDLDGDADIKMMETTNAGTSWSAVKRVNQDPIANGKLQDLVWAAFDEDGDLVVCWRDRRNGNGNTFDVASEIYCTHRYNNSTTFEPDYAINPLVPHDAVLEEKGNDFMNVQVKSDTAYAIWGDVRNGSLRIYLNKWSIRTGTSSLTNIYEDKQLNLSPNPVENAVQIPASMVGRNFQLFSQNGQLLEEGKFTEQHFNCEKLRSGAYFFRAIGDKDVVVLRFQKI